jgi:hypothetical protein
MRASELLIVLIIVAIVFLLLWRIILMIIVAVITALVILGAHALWLDIQGATKSDQEVRSPNAVSQCGLPAQGS